MGNEIFNLKAIAAQRRKQAAKLRKIERKARNGEPPKYQFGMKKEFYLTREWKNVRWDALERSDKHCQVCGRGKEHGVILHVDHILPRSKFPLLELNIDNLQVLCEDCNIGKGAKYKKQEPVKKQEAPQNRE